MPSRRPSAVTRRRCGGQAIVETTMALMLLCVIFFGLSQIAYLYSARMISNHAAFVTARSHVVGFDEYRVRRAGEVGTIPMAGPLVQPVAYANLGAARLGELEPTLIEDFLQTPEYTLYYDYWGDRDSPTPVGGATRIGTDLPVVNFDGMIDVGIHVRDYPVQFPLHRLFSDRESVDFDTRVEMYNHAAFYLQ